MHTHISISVLLNSQTKNNEKMNDQYFLLFVVYKLFYMFCTNIFFIQLFSLQENTNHQHAILHPNFNSINYFPMNEHKLDDTDWDMDDDGDAENNNNNNQENQNGILSSSTLMYNTDKDDKDVVTSDISIGNGIVENSNINQNDNAKKSIKQDKLEIE